ncbi:MAG: hypothetical protein U0931_41460 [Vulcanimicrobiota bacterium]
MEVTHGAWGGMFSCFDESGRQLGEHNVTPILLRCPVETEWRAWKSGGSRDGGRLNQTAFSQVARLWPHILDFVSKTRNEFLNLHLPNKPALSLSDLFIVSHIISAQPAFHVRRRSSSRTPRLVPILHAAAYKVSAGIHMAIAEMIQGGEQALLDDAPCNSHDFVRFVEERGLLRSRGGRVCGGTSQMFHQLLDTLSQPNLDNLPTAMTPSFQYGQLCARIELATIYHCTACAASIDSSPPLLARLSLLKELLKRYWPDARELLMETAIPYGFSAVEETALPIFQHLHEQVHRALGFPCPARQLRLSDIAHRSVRNHYHSSAQGKLAQQAKCLLRSLYQRLWLRES